MTDSNTDLQAELETTRKSEAAPSKLFSKGGLVQTGSGGEVKADEAPPAALRPSYTPRPDTGRRLAPLVDTVTSQNTAKKVSVDLNEVLAAKAEVYRAIQTIDEEMNKLFEERARLSQKADDLSRSEAILVAANNEANSPRWQR